VNAPRIAALVLGLALAPAATSVAHAEEATAAETARALAFVSRVEGLLPNGMGGAGGRRLRAWQHPDCKFKAQPIPVRVVPLEDIVALMERKRIKRVPVLCGGELVGIVTRSNLMRAMVSLARGAPPVAKGDAAIRDRLLAEFNKETWAPIATVDVQVNDGVVELWGAVFDERQREALRVAAENIPGVKAVKDNLSWIEPVSGLVIESKEDVPAHQATAVA